MKKKQFEGSIHFALPVGIVVLCVGLIFAARTLQDDATTDPFICGDGTRADILAAYSHGEVGTRHKKFTREQLTDYLARYAKVAGRPDVLLKYMPTVIDYGAFSLDDYSRKKQRVVRRGSSKHIQIRPERAHKLWKRLQIEEVFRWPVHPTRFWISSYFGPRTLNGRKGFHYGLDMAAATGTPVVAARAGTVLEAQYASGYGNYIVIAHGPMYKTRYAHLSRILVKPGQRVRAGLIIGKVGATGKVAKNKTSSSASHLHFEVYIDGKRVNPLKYLA